MIQQYLEIFYTTAEALVPVIPAVFGVALILHWIGSLLFDR